MPPDDEPWTHHEAIVNDVRLHYVAAGPEDGDLVVLLHGFPEFWYSWHEQLPALADAGYRVLAPDMRGYNRSEKPPGVASYRTSELVADVVGLIEHAGRESAHVVGHDWGGATAWGVGIGVPQVVDRLAILNSPHPTAFERELTSNLDQLRKSWYMFAFQLPWLPEFVLTVDDARFLERFLTGVGADDDTFSPADLRRYRDAFTRPGAARAAINYYRASVRGMLKGLPGGGVGEQHVDVPTLVLWGEEDRALGTDLLDGLDAWVPDLQVERLPDANHWVQLDAPDRVNAALLDFLDE
jgi:pimeloyl-ACP methyl ester carboxylesterase